MAHMLLRQTRILSLLAGLAASVAPLTVLAPAPASADPEVVPPYSASKPATVREVRRIGTSVQGRAIRAYRLGESDSPVKAVILGAMHGDEQAGMAVVRSLRDGEPVSGVDLWVIPTMNPDGVARNSRQNARGVDLNRNFSHRWAPLTGKYYSGTGPFSEPESRAMRDFLKKVKPRFFVSFHQPLYGIGDAGERRPFLRRLARGLDLPIRSFNCTGVCHGSMTSWHNHHFAGTAVTVEFGYSPSRAYLRGTATRGTLRAVLGSR